MGFQGSGIIEDCDREEDRGRPVSMFANMKNGTYANYIVSDSSDVIKWPKQPELSQQ